MILHQISVFHLRYDLSDMKFINISSKSFVVYNITPEDGYNLLLISISQIKIFSTNLITPNVVFTVSRINKIKIESLNSI